RRGRESELRHRVNNAALHRFQAVGDMRQRAIEDDVHRIVEIRLTREIRDRSLLDVGRDRWRRAERQLFFRGGFLRGHECDAKGKPSTESAHGKNFESRATFDRCTAANASTASRISSASFWRWRERLR